jgi:hypothetical protein
LTKECPPISPSLRLHLISFDIKMLCQMNAEAQAVEEGVGSAMCCLRAKARRSNAQLSTGNRLQTSQQY